MDLETRLRLNREIQLELSTLMDHLQDACVLMDEDGNLGYANPAFEKISGWGRDELIQMLWEEIFQADDSGPDNRPNSFESSEKVEGYLRARHGGRIPVAVSQSVFLDDHQKLKKIHFIGDRTGNRLLESSFEAYSYLLNHNPSDEDMARTVLMSAISLTRADGAAYIHFESGQENALLLAFREESLDDYSVLFTDERFQVVKSQETYGNFFFMIPDQKIETRDLLPASGVTSTMLVPVQTESRVYGVIHVYSFHSNYTFDQQNMELLKTFTSTVAVTLENRRSRLVMERENETLRLLSEMNKSLQPSTSVQTLVETLLKKAVEWTGMDKGLAFVYQKETKNYIRVAWHGIEESQLDLFDEYILSYEEFPLLLKLIHQEGGVSLRDVAQHPALGRCFVPSDGSFLCLPLLEGQALVGIIFLGAVECASEEVLEVFRKVEPLFSGQAARAIQASRLFSELEARQKDLETATQTLIHSEKLATVGQLASAVAHQIRNPLSVIGANIELLMDDSAISEYHLNLMENLTHKVAETDLIIQELMDISRPLPLHIQRSHLGDSFSVIKRFISNKCEKQGVILRMELADNLPEVWMDATQLERCLLDICLNDLQEMPDGGTLDIIARHQEKQILLEVRDNGRALDTRELVRIFEPFEQIRSKASGLGLFNIRRISNEMGIEVNIRNEPSGKGVVFTFIFSESTEMPQPIFPRFKSKTDKT